MLPRARAVFQRTSFARTRRLRVTSMAIPRKTKKSKSTCAVLSLSERRRA